MNLILALENKLPSPNEHYQRLIDFAKSVVVQHPEYSLQKCQDCLKRYMKFVGLDQRRYKTVIVKNHLNFKWADSADIYATIYLRSAEAKQYLTIKPSFS